MKISKATLDRVRDAYYALDTLRSDTPANELEFLGLEFDSLFDLLAHTLLDRDIQ